MRHEECGDYIGGLPVTSTADDAMQNARGVASFLTQESIQKRFYCYNLMDTLDRYYLRDLAFLRDPDCWHKKEGFSDISFPESSERRELLGSALPEELLPEQLPESDPDEPDEESEDWWEFLRENTNHLDSLEGAGFTGWQVDLYEYKGT